MPGPAEEPSPEPDVRARITLRVAGAATALVLVAFTMPLGLLATIAPDLSAGDVGRTWILSSMSVGLAGALLVAGSLADDLGRRRIFLAGLAVFGVGGLLGAAAPSVLVLSLARALQGIGGAALLATSLSLIAGAFPAGPARVHATGVWGAMIGLGIAAGPLAGSLIAEVGSWRTAYVALGLLSLAALVPGARGLRESRAPERRPLDPVGAALLGAGLTTLTTGVVQGNAAGWGGAVPVAAFAATLVLLAGFARWELRSAAPVFDVRLLARAGFTGALIGSFVLGVAVLAFMSYVMTWMHVALGASVVGAALWGLPWSAVAFLVSMRARVLGRFLTPRAQTAIGLLVCAVGLFAMRGLDAGSSPAHLAPGLAVLGIGTGLLNAALAQAAVTVVPPSRSGMGAGANNTARYLGAALGVPLVVGLLRTGTADRVADGQAAAAAATGAMNALLLVVAGIAVAGAIAVFVLLRPARAQATPTTEKALA
ncbi:MFS transporter [Patulibacter sp.]|uniref:MFS transporter n=1 Tax=Patulibacter sp. TaxID=1912859 RepID=UPI002722811D|nr:MFS transporter [Patulibacter sp.]MDO9410345.1 MFS transporter [Patulibacter sp.]